MQNEHEQFTRKDSSGCAQENIIMANLLNFQRAK